MKRFKISKSVLEAINVEKSSAIKLQEEALQTTPLQKAQTVYFSMYIYNMSDPDDSDPVEELRAGKTYLLEIVCKPRPSLINEGLKQEECSITGAFSLRLSYHPDVSVETPIMPAENVFTFDAVFEGCFTCGAFTLPADWPECHVRIDLTLKVPSTKYVPVTKYTVPVHGQQKPLEIEICEVSQINQRLPKETAILLVETVAQQAAYPQSIHFRGWSEAGQPLDGTAEMSSIVSIEELQAYRQKKQEKELGPDELLNRQANFSRKSPYDLLLWLDKLCAEYEERLNLIIVDLTEIEIPWELLKFERYSYLGARARVVHWLPVQYYKQWRKLYIEPSSHQGPVISYLDDRLGPELIQNEQEVLRCLAGEPYATLSALRERLDDSLEEVGLIYVGCHGISGKHLMQQNDPEFSSIFSSIKLEDMDYRETPRLTAFINACESARIIKKSPDDNSNFVDAFLAYCASGFVGTLAQVDVRTASEIAGKILRSALQPNGVQIAEQLRLLRKLEAERLKQKREDASAQSAEYFRLIDTFMYVYYGNPLARLQLHRREEAEE